MMRDACRLIYHDGTQATRTICYVDQMVTHDTHPGLPVPSIDVEYVEVVS